MVDLLLTPRIGLIFWQTVVLLVAYFLLRRFAWGPLLAFMEEEEKGHEEAVTQADKAKKMLERARVTREQVLEEAHAKRDRILSRAMATQKALVSEATLKADEVKKEKMQEAKVEIAKERRAALYAFKGDAGTLVVRAAQKLMGQPLKEEHVQELVLTKMIEEAFKEQKKEMDYYAVGHERK